MSKKFDFRRLFAGFLMLAAILVAGCATTAYSDPWNITWVGKATNDEGKLLSVVATCTLKQPIFDKVARDKIAAAYAVGDIPENNHCAQIAYQNNLGNNWVRDFGNSGGATLGASLIQADAARSVAKKSCSGTGCPGGAVINITPTASATANATAGTCATCGTAPAAPRP